MSKTLLQIHGLLYVVYLLADFRIWRLAELKFKDFMIIAMGGIVPLSSFFIERSYHRKLEVIFAEKAGKQN
jgi:integral membrane protein